MTGQPWREWQVRPGVRRRRRRDRLVRAGVAGVGDVVVDLQVRAGVLPVGDIGLELPLQAVVGLVSDPDRVADRAPGAGAAVVLPPVGDNPVGALMVGGEATRLNDHEDAAGDNDREKGPKEQDSRGGLAPLDSDGPLR